MDTSNTEADGGEVEEREPYIIDMDESKLYKNKFIEKNIYKIGDIVKTDNGTIVKITKIKGNFIDGKYYGINGKIKGTITTININDISPYKDTKWLKEINIKNKLYKRRFIKEEDYVSKIKKDLVKTGIKIDNV